MLELPICDIETLSEQVLLEKKGSNGFTLSSVATNLHIVKPIFSTCSILNKMKWGVF